MYYAHTGIPNDKQTWQKLSEHLNNVANDASIYAEKFGYGKIAYVIGILHDIGKYSDSFQRKLDGVSQRVDHSTAGAQLANEKYPPLNFIISHCIAGHHGGLLDTFNSEGGSGLCDRLSKKIDDYSSYRDELSLPDNDLCPNNFAPMLVDPPFSFRIGVLIRMLYSCLIDADWEDASKYNDKITNNKENNIDVSYRLDLHTIKTKLFTYIKKIESDARLNEQRENNIKILDLRAKILQSCKHAAKERQGVFTLTVPTGGGKTLSSLAFALEHALKHNMDRIIYVVPFTSVTEQIAEVFRKAIGDDSILEHHSAFDNSNMSDIGLNKLKIAWDKWNYPIVVTTTVQFFESLFSNKPRKCRKLHNIANSVIILDEAQSIPLEVLRPCVAMLDTLSKYFNTTIVLCTATQPTLNKSDGFEGGFDDVYEIASNPSKMAIDMQRTRIINLGTITDNDLAGRLVGRKEFFDYDKDNMKHVLNNHKQVLCIVNTRKHAKDLYEHIDADHNTYHLSALMCPKHRSTKLKEIKCALKSNKKCIVISTSLIEAGVDVDFGAVYREINGLESIAQAAGRCNREGLHNISNVYIFNSSSLSPSIQLRASACMSIMDKFKNPLSPKAMLEYFKKIYWTNIVGDSDGLDKKNIMKLCFSGCDNMEFGFMSMAHKFKLMNDVTKSIIIRYDEHANFLIEELKKKQKLGDITKRLQPYIVQVYKNDFIRLESAGAISKVAEEKFDDQFWVLDNQIYDFDTFGLKLVDPAYRDVEDNII
ncbi:MAG: CRISPR-associated helicase Cas3 family protein [Cenarchaeum symbiont of Oopsacas minuta]|nr:CRISPR-associated helicase Cas3 family protein [Cenarchaeum symbiont of Oopsacas minuta]